MLAMLAASFSNHENIHAYDNINGTLECGVQLMQCVNKYVR